MAVYTIVDTQELHNLLSRYDIGTLISCKGIAEGVENSNYFIETDKSKYVLTIYENRVNKDELPFFFDLLEHLHQAACPVPKFIAANDGSILQNVAGKPACIIEFLSGVSITRPTVAAARSTGAQLAKMHVALRSFSGSRRSSMDLPHWQGMLDSCSRADILAINPNLYSAISDELDYLTRHWPDHLPKAVIHGDLFPDNILLLGDEVSGLIDFYFAATDIIDYDIAVTHAAWCFSADGKNFDINISKALLSAYDEICPISQQTKEHLQTLFRGACLRFILSRTVDWINTPADALVTKKDPIDFLNRLEYYKNAQNINPILNFNK